MTLWAAGEFSSSLPLWARLRCRYGFATDREVGNFETMARNLARRHPAQNSSGSSASACDDVKSCEDVCLQSCKLVCEGSCQDACKFGCQETCEHSCQSACKQLCEEACLSVCQEACRHSCQDICQTRCQDSCQLGCRAAEGSGRTQVTKKAFFIPWPDCNLHCQYCFQRGGDAPHLYKSYSGATATQSTVRQFLYFCETQGITQVDLFGGEPLLHEDIFSFIVERCAEKHIQLGVITNGTLITSGTMKLIEDNDIAVLLSLDGTRDRHDSLRGGFDKISPWFKRLAALPRVSVAMQAGIVGGLYDNLRYIWQTGFRKVYVNVIETYGWYRDDDVELFEREYEAATLAMIMGEGILNCAIQMHESLKHSTHTQECGIINSGIACDWNGRLYPCHRAMELGNLLTIGDIHNGINGETNGKVRNMLKNSGFSSKSAREYPLVSFCPISTFQNSQTFDGVWNDSFCKMINVKAKVVSKYHYELGRVCPRTTAVSVP